MIESVVLAFLLFVAPRCPDPKRMVQIPQGRFWMGSDRAERRLAHALSSRAMREAGWFEAELPRRRVTLPAFCIDRPLVTQAQYAAFVAQTGHRPPGITKDEYLKQGFLVHDYDREVTRYLWREGSPPADLTDHPVVLVSADAALAYCRWRHPALRLPSEAEWEKAARGDDGRSFPWGDRWDPERLNSAARGLGGTTPATRCAARASPYGIFDAAGNVFQWTATSLSDGRRHILIGLRCAGPAERPLTRPETSRASRARRAP